MLKHIVVGAFLLACTPASSDVKSAKTPTTTAAPTTTAPATTAPATTAPATGKPKAMTDQEIEQSARKALETAGVANVAAFKTAPGPGNLYSPSTTMPFIFYTMIGAPGKPGRAEEKHIVAVDTRDGKGYYKDPKALEVFLKAKDYPAQGNLKPQDVLHAWHALATGQEITLTGPDATGDAKLKAMLSVPATTTEADGTRVTVGWTSEQRGTAFTRHTIRVGKDGKTDVTSSPQP
jgi:hypothetical protein